MEYRGGRWNYPTIRQARLIQPMFYHWLSCRSAVVGSPQLSDNLRVFYLHQFIQLEDYNCFATFKALPTHCKITMASAMSLFHFSMFIAYGFTLYEAFFDMDIPMLKERFKEFDPGQFKYLTIWGVIIQAVFFFLCLLNDLYGTNKIVPKQKAPISRRIKDYFHATFSFPLAMFVGITFWSLMFVDRELVLPKALDPYFPRWLNHLMHTLIMVSTVIEMIAAPRQYPKRSHGLAGLSVLMLTYLTWIHVIYYKSGIWVYPVMDVLSLPLRIAFFLVLFLFSSLLYYVGETFDKLVWGANKRTATKTKKKSK